jgi:hypothetical protein
VSVPGPVESKTAERSIQCRRHHYSCPRPTQDISPPQLEEHDASSLIHGCGLCTVIVGTASRPLPAARGTARCTVAGGAGSSPCVSQHFPAALGQQQPPAIAGTSSWAAARWRLRYRRCPVPDEVIAAARSTTSGQRWQVVRRSRHAVYG